MTPTELYLSAIAGRSALIDDTEAAIRVLLAEALAEIRVRIAQQPSDYLAWYLPGLTAQIEDVLRQVGAVGGAKAAESADKAWTAGEALVDDAVQAARLRVALPRLDVGQLRAMKAFATERIRDVSLQAASEINASLAWVVIGTKTPHDAVQDVARILDERALGRASSIVYTNLAQAHSTATQVRLEQFIADVPGLSKKWIKSGKREPRPAHAAINGQMQRVSDPFILKGGAVKMMFPHDPAAPIGEVANCGCISVPVVPGWNRSLPDGAADEARDGRDRLQALRNSVS